MDDEGFLRCGRLVKWFLSRGKDELVGLVGIRRSFDQN